MTQRKFYYTAADETPAGGGVGGKEMTAMAELFSKWHEINSTSEFFEWVFENEQRLLELERKQIVEAWKSGHDGDLNLSGLHYFDRTFKL